MTKLRAKLFQMNRSIIQTEDGSHTLYVPELDEHFHSTHGAIQESNHVFIKNGLLKCNKPEITLFEVGFGTGLNALLSIINKGNKMINYISIEKYPLNETEYSTLNYCDLLGKEWDETFKKMHESEWGKSININSNFTLTKIQADLENYNLKNLPPFDLVYFDAFAPSKQEKMWKEQIMQKIAGNTSPHGIFATYCAKGEVRRSLMRSGFNMQRLEGPPGKKEMLYGEKDV